MTDDARERAREAFDRLEEIAAEVHNAADRILEALRSGGEEDGYNLTDRVLRVLELADVERDTLGHAYLGTEHVVLGLLAEGESVGCAVLHQLDCLPELTDARRMVLKIVGGKDPCPTCSGVGFVSEFTGDETSMNATNITCPDCRPSTETDAPDWTTWEKCQSCGRRYGDVYWADDEQWEKVVGDAFGGLLCPGCFKEKAESLGLEPKIEILAPPLSDTDAPGEGEHPGVKEAEDLRDMLAMTADEAKAWKPDPDEGSGSGSSPSEEEHDMTANEMLVLAQSVYDGLTDEQIQDIEDAAGISVVAAPATSESGEEPPGDPYTRKHLRDLLYDEINYAARTSSVKPKRVEAILTLWFDTWAQWFAEQDVQRLRRLRRAPDEGVGDWIVPN